MSFSGSLLPRRASVIWSPLTRRAGSSATPEERHSAPTTDCRTGRDDRHHATCRGRIRGAHVTLGLTFVGGSCLLAIIGSSVHSLLIVAALSMLLIGPGGVLMRRHCVSPVDPKVVVELAGIAQQIVFTDRQRTLETRRPSDGRSHILSDIQEYIRLANAVQSFGRNAEDLARIAAAGIVDGIRMLAPRTASNTANEPREQSSEVVRQQLQAALIALSTLQWEIGLRTRLRLSGLDLRGYNLEGLNLSAAQLDFTDLRECFLNGAMFDGADLRNAKLDGAVGGNVSFRHALLERASFKNVYMPSANFSDTLLIATRFGGAVLAGSAFDRSVAARCDLHNTDLRGASFALMVGREVFDLISSLRRVD